MYDEIGKKIKTLAIATFIVEAIASVILGIYFIFDYADLLIILLTFIAGPIVAWVSSWLLYGLGEIIDRLCAIDRNTRAEVKSNAQTKEDDKKISQIERLRSKSLISEEEYKKEYKKVNSK